MPPKRSRYTRYRSKRSKPYGRVRSVRRRKIFRKKKQVRVARKLKSSITYGPRIATRATLTKLKWFQDYISATGLGATYTSIPDNGNQGLSFSFPSGEYVRRWNISSIYHPDVAVVSAGQTHTCYNWSEFNKYYTKWFVRACKVNLWFRATGENGGQTSSFAPTQIVIWCDNVNNDTDVTTIQQAMCQPGAKYLVLSSNPYNSTPVKWFKNYYSAKRVLKRSFDEDDYGTCTSGGAGVNPADDACMFLHILIRPAAPSGQNTRVNMGFQLKFYTKWWDATTDAINEVDPNS